MPRPINWRTLSSDDAEHEWLDLNEWVNWLRHEFALPPQIVPPMWHRHPELVWELSALYTRWLGCYDPEQDAAGAISFMTDFAAARTRLREWVQIAGTRLDLLEAMEAIEVTHPQYVEPLLLRDVYGLTYEEIASQIGAPVGTVKAQVHHGRKMARPLLRGQE